MVKLIFCTLMALAGSAAAQPVVSSGGVLNVANYAYTGLPNSAIAQGSLFAIFGTGLGPSSSPTLAFPLAASLGGVSINLVQGGASVPVIPVYVSDTQINAIMPSTAQAGASSLTVTYNGQTSVAVLVQVAASSFGIFTINSAGSGPAVVTNAQGQVIQYNSAASPGQTVILYGTGLGAIAGSDAQPPPVGNIASNSPMIYVGGTMVAPSYHGRSSCCSGLDQINFTLPPGTTGCNVPIAVQVGNTVSNFASIAVAAGGGACIDSSGLSSNLFSKTASQSSTSLGQIQYTRFTDTSPGFNLLGGGGSSTVTGQLETASFNKEAISNAGQLAQILNPGACSVYTFTGASKPALPGAGNAALLDAGSAITVMGGNAQGQLNPPAGKAGPYTANFAFTPGLYMFNGPGGKDVGSFTVSLQVPQAGLSWTNQSSVSPIQRANGVTVAWTGADPNGTVSVNGYSVGGADLPHAVGAGFTCTVPANSAQFTVPATVLLALPASSTFSSALITTVTGALSISTNSQPVTFTATGLDVGLAAASVSISNSTFRYQ